MSYTTRINQVCAQLKAILTMVPLFLTMTRYILMLRVWHPDLSSEEREALQFIYDVLEIPELLSDDAGTRFVAEERARMAKEFPLKATGGFGANKSKRKKVKGKKKSRK